MGQSQRAAADQSMNRRIVESIARDSEPDTLTPLELALNVEPITRPPRAKPVRAWQSRYEPRKPVRALFELFQPRGVLEWPIVDGKETKLNKAMAAEVRAERGARSLTQEQLAARAGISYSTIKRIERGDVDISTGDLGAIAAVFSATEPAIGPAELMERAVKRAGGYEVLLSEAPVTPDELDTKRKQNEARAMSTEQIETMQHAATRDPELDSDEPE